MPVFHIDDQPVEFQPGEKILSAALRNGKKIPHYCYHPGMSIVATCRMCVVDIVDLGNGRPAPKLQTACSVDAAEGMKIETMNQKVEEGRKLVNEFLLINHPLDCPICDQSGNVVSKITHLNMVQENLKWIILNVFTVGVTLELLSVLNATAAFSVRAVIDSLEKSREQMNLVCLIGGMN